MHWAIQRNIPQEEGMLLSTVMATMGTDLKYKQQFSTKFNNSICGMGRCWSVPSVPAEKGHQAKRKHYGNSSKISVLKYQPLSFAIVRRHRMNSNTISLRIQSISKIISKWMEKRDNGAHPPYNSPMACYQQIKNSDAFFLQTGIKVPSKMYRGERNKSSEQNTEMIMTTTSLTY